MMQVRYEFPLPNDGEEYRFTVEELVKLLDRVYDKGKADEKELQRIMLENVTTKSINAGVWLVN